jgi:hypothetical protein
MTKLPPSHAEDELGHLAQRFVHWRQGRTTPRGRIPQPLWEQAVALTQVLPLSRVAKRLGLCPQRLKKRGGGKPAAAGVTACPAPLHFVEVAASAVGRSFTTEVEVHRTDGTRLRLTYGEAHSARVPLLQTFLASR